MIFTRFLIEITLDQSEEIEELNSDETFAFLNILEMLSNTSEFRQWLKDHHGLTEHEKIFDGYKFAIITSLLAFMNSFTMHDPFKLEDDEISYRAEFRGIKLEKIPNSCEKIIFQKNVWNLGKNIRRATNWQTLNVQKELSPLFEIQQKLREDHIKTTGDMSVPDALKFLSEFYTYLFLIDTKHGRPKGYYHPFFSTERSTQYLDRVFDGYVYSLQFIWYQMLGKDNFLKSCLKDLHRCQEINLHDKNEISINMNEIFEFQEIELSPEEKTKQENWNKVYKKWSSIDQFFGEIRDEIIKPLEKKIDYRFAGFNKGLIQLAGFDKSILGNLLDKKILDEPEFMKKNDLESMKKRLDVEFLWYDIDMFDSGEANLEFNGVFAFNALLTGYVTILKEQGIEGTITVMKIIHPDPHQNINYYSLAIKIGIGGFISDSSGWIVFYDSLMDTPGTGGHYRDMCFDCIDKFKQQSRVDLKEITVEKKTFRDYLESRKISFSNSRELSTAYKDIEDNLAQMKGKFFEYVFLKHCLDSEEYDLVRGDFSTSGQQIDCICLQKDIVYVFECKLQFHDDELQDYVDQFRRIIDAVKKEYPDKKTVPILIVYSPVMGERVLKLEKQGINVEDNFKTIIQNEGIFDGERHKIFQALDFNIKDKFYRNYDKDWFT